MILSRFLPKESPPEKMAPYECGCPRSATRANGIDQFTSCDDLTAVRHESRSLSVGAGASLLGWGGYVQVALFTAVLSAGDIYVWKRALYEQESDRCPRKIGPSRLRPRSTIVKWAAIVDLTVTFGLAWCHREEGDELERYDIARFGAEVFRGSPRQSFCVVAGRLSRRWRRRSAACTTVPAEVVSRWRLRVDWWSSIITARTGG